jgi:DNA-binding NarL/FixJ family response regulator
MKAQASIAVMIASDHPIMRDGLRLRIQRETDMYVVCEAANLKQILNGFHTCRPDVLVLDLHLPRGAGVRALRSIRSLAPLTPLVVLADYPDELPESCRAGPGTTLTVLKISANEHIIPTIREAIATP